MKSQTRSAGAGMVTFWSMIKCLSPSSARTFLGSAAGRRSWSVPAEEARAPSTAAGRRRPRTSLLERQPIADDSARSTRVDWHTTTPAAAARLSASSSPGVGRPGTGAGTDNSLCAGRDCSVDHHAVSTDVRDDDVHSRQRVQAKNIELGRGRVRLLGAVIPVTRPSHSHSRRPEHRGRRTPARGTWRSWSRRAPARIVSPSASSS